MFKNNQFSHSISVFRDLELPEPQVSLAGYAALIQAFNLQVPLPEILFAIRHRHVPCQKHRWHLLTPRHAPRDTIYGHLKFALKHEGIDLPVLKNLFDAIGPEPVVEIVNQEPTSAYARRIWFLYEWLQNTKLNLLDVKNGNFVDVLNSKLQYPGPARISKRHRIRNNLPGVQAFCPIIRRTARLDSFIEMQFNEQAETMISHVRSELIKRATTFLLLSDSKASYAIEGEAPSQNRVERWAQAIAEAGKHELSHKEFLRLQEIIISDFRFTHFGYRKEGGFIGEHERSTGTPIPDHISARPEDLYSLLEGLIATNHLFKESAFNAVLAAAVIAFGFVFIHPFEDGNGRIHRYLFHHVLSEKKFIPKGMIFPVSSVILQKINQYREVLESYSRPRLKLIKWQSTPRGNVQVLNDTINLYRYFDATEQALFLFECVKETIENTLPEEIRYLKKYDEMKRFINSCLEMPNKLVDLLIRFLNQEHGQLSKRAREKEFSTLTESEIKTLESKYAEIFLE